MLEADESQGSTQNCTTLIEQRDYQLSYIMLTQAPSDDVDFFLSAKQLEMFVCLADSSATRFLTHTETRAFTSRLFPPHLGNGWRC